MTKSIDMAAGAILAITAIKFDTGNFWGWGLVLAAALVVISAGMDYDNKT